jgi:phage replication-related protein YjqB (UPF0714/DUF867 family)
MADRYRDFGELSRNERAGEDYRILLRLSGTTFAVVAPHGGGIEPGTSEIADAIAGEQLSFYAFDGLKNSGNGALHITSTHFDEPMSLRLVGAAHIVITIHGEESEADGEGVFLGGLNIELARRIGGVLRVAGFAVSRHPDPDLQGTEPQNLCNRGISGRGLQLELSRTVRREMFSSLSRSGRQHPTQKFHEFVDAIRAVLL